MANRNIKMSHPSGWARWTARLTGSALVALAMILAACGPGARTSGAEVSPTASPTAKPSPTRTPLQITRDVSFEDFAGFRWADFTPVEHDERVELQAKILDEPRLAAGVTALEPVKFTPNIYPDGTSIAMYCVPNINCTPRFAVKEQSDQGELHLVIWELVISEDDATNTRAALVTVHEPQKDEFRDAELRYLHDIGKAQFNLTITLIADYPGSESAIWDSVLAKAPASENLAAWIVEHQSDDPMILATAILGH